MQHLLEAHHTPFFELVDKYFACRTESIFNDVLAPIKQNCYEFIKIIIPIFNSFQYSRCQLELETTALHFKEELEHNISNVSTSHNAFSIKEIQWKNYISRNINSSWANWWKMVKNAYLEKNRSFIRISSICAQCTEALNNFLQTFIMYR